MNKFDAVSLFLDLVSTRSNTFSLFEWVSYSSRTSLLVWASLVSSRVFSARLRCCEVPVAVCETFAQDFSADFRALPRARERRAISINLSCAGRESLFLFPSLCDKRHAWEAARTSRSRVNEPLNRECNPRVVMHANLCYAFEGATHFFIARLPVAIARIEMTGKSVFERARKLFVGVRGNFFKYVNVFKFCLEVRHMCESEKCKFCVSCKVICAFR